MSNEKADIKFRRVIVIVKSTEIPEIILLKYNYIKNKMINNHSTKGNVFMPATTSIAIFGLLGPINPIGLSGIFFEYLSLF